MHQRIGSYRVGVDIQMILLFVQLHGYKPKHAPFVNPPDISVGHVQKPTSTRKHLSLKWVKMDNPVLTSLAPSSKLAITRHITAQKMMRDE
jgi:hypothetical protein